MLYQVNCNSVENYKNTLEYLYKQLPMFHRIGAAAYKADLKNTYAIMELLDHPENKFRAVHVAGTNGKGSTSHMLAAIFQSAGYKTGLYTSPHLIDFRERIRINGKMISQKRVVEFVEENKTEFEKIQLSFFEWTVGLAFQFFAEEKVDIAIIETGLGGRLDSTNVITPDLAVITNISYDHKALLGDTLPKIAGEKAGIIKPHVPVVIGERQAEISEVFVTSALKMNSDILFAEDHYKVTSLSSDTNFRKIKVEKDGEMIFPSLTLDLPGVYQLKNVSTVLQSIEILRKKYVKITDKHIAAALGSVRSITGLAGRWQKIGESPLTICDVGHNEAGIAIVVDQLSKTPHEKLHIVFGMVNDKEIGPVLSRLPRNATYYFCKSDLPRSLEPDKLQEEAIKFGLSGAVFQTAAAAFLSAKEHAFENDLIFIGGSTFIVAEVLKDFQSTN